MPASIKKMNTPQSFLSGMLLSPQQIRNKLENYPKLKKVRNRPIAASLQLPVDSAEATEGGSPRARNLNQKGHNAGAEGTLLPTQPSLSSKPKRVENNRHFQSALKSVESRSKMSPLLTLDASEDEVLILE